MYCTRKQIAYVIGEEHMTSWRTIRDRIDALNKQARRDRQITYYLRRDARNNPFDIQVCHDSLSSDHKQYLRYRAIQHGDSAFSPVNKSVKDVGAALRRPVLLPPINTIDEAG